MRILFGRAGAESGAGELKNLTGSYYANNDFDKIRQNIKLETEKVIELIGTEVYKLAENFYYSENSIGIPDPELLELLEFIQLPIALFSVIRFYGENLVSHESAGRKAKVDKNNEVLPWEWMIDKDDAAHERKAYDALDRLFRYLDNSELPEWKNSPAQKASRDLFVNSARIFDDAYPIDRSGRFYYSVVPFLREIQQTKIARALGSARYAQILAWHKQPGNTETEQSMEQSIIVSFIQKAMPLLAMEIAVQRFSVQLLPFCVVQQLKSAGQSNGSNQVALEQAIERFAGRLKKSAASALNELQLFLHTNDPEMSEYQLLPDNCRDQGFFRT